MSRIAIVGAGIGGLASSLLLARDGHEVTVYERDAAPVPNEPDDMWSEWARPGTPQARLGHTFLAGTRRLLEKRLPEVVTGVFDCGAQPWDVADEIPGDRVAEDDELMMIMMRRPVFEGVMRRICNAERSIAIECGIPVTGLVAERTPGSSIPRVVGIELRGGDTVAADTVIAAGGRSLPIERWLTAIGADTPASEAEACGSNCYTRYFRLRDSGEHSATRQLRFHHEPGYGVAELIGADNGTFACELAMPTADRDFHQLRDVSAWTAAAGSVAPWREWLDPERSKPITPGIDIMGQERDTLRHFVRNGHPLALGVHAIGDARCQTDSLFAWGCGNALLAATALADAIADHPDDPHDQALALEAAIQHELSGRYTHSRDRNRAFALAANGQQPDQTPTRVIDDVMYPAIKHDPEVYRAVMRWELQLDGADALSDNQPIIQLAHSVQQESPHDADDFPTRDELVAAVRSAS